MWGRIIDYGKQLVAVVQKQRNLEEDIKELRQELKDVRQDINHLRDDNRDLARTLERLAYEIQRDRDRAEDQRKVLLLEIENHFLRLERGLPPGDKPERTPPTSPDL